VESLTSSNVQKACLQQKPQIAQCTNRVPQAVELT